MAYTTRYAFKRQARLATDSGLSESAVSRLIAGKCLRTFQTAVRVTAALERKRAGESTSGNSSRLTAHRPPSQRAGLMGCKGCTLTSRNL